MAKQPSIVSAFEDYVIDRYGGNETNVKNVLEKAREGKDSNTSDPNFMAALYLAQRLMPYDSYGLPTEYVRSWERAGGMDAYNAMGAPNKAEYDQWYTGIKDLYNQQMADWRATFDQNVGTIKTDGQYASGAEAGGGLSGQGMMEYRNAAKTAMRNYLSNQIGRPLTDAEWNAVNADTRFRNEFDGYQFVTGGREAQDDFYDSVFNDSFYDRMGLDPVSGAGTAPVTDDTSYRPPPEYSQPEAPTGGTTAPTGNTATTSGGTSSMGDIFGGLLGSSQGSLGGTNPNSSVGGTTGGTTGGSNGIWVPQIPDSGSGNVGATGGTEPDFTLGDGSFAGYGYSSGGSDPWSNSGLPSDGQYIPSGNEELYSAQLAALMAQQQDFYDQQQAAADSVGSNPQQADFSWGWVPGGLPDPNRDIVQDYVGSAGENLGPTGGTREVTGWNLKSGLNPNMTDQQVLQWAIANGKVGGEQANWLQKWDDTWDPNSTFLANAGSPQGITGPWSGLDLTPTNYGYAKSFASTLYDPVYAE